MEQQSSNHKSAQRYIFSKIGRLRKPKNLILSKLPEAKDLGRGGIILDNLRNLRELVIILRRTPGRTQHLVSVKNAKNEQSLNAR